MTFQCESIKKVPKSLTVQLLTKISQHFHYGSDLCCPQIDILLLISNGFVRTDTLQVVVGITLCPTGAKVNQRLRVSHTRKSGS